MKNISCNIVSCNFQINHTEMLLFLYYFMTFDTINKTIFTKTKLILNDFRVIKQELNFFKLKITIIYLTA